MNDIIPAITGNYERPISTPLKDRRPSSETCEKCHMPEKFFGDVPIIKTTYGADESNTSSATQVNLTWVDNANNETGMRVERATNNTFTTNLVSVTLAASAVSYSDTTVIGSTSYYYRVFAYNSAGDSLPSNTASVTTPAAINAAALYSSYCASCHGANRKGGAGPPLTTTALANRTLDWVTSRVNHSGRLTSAQVSAMAQYLKTTPP